MAGVSFVSGSFVLADSLKSSIDGFISELVQNTDLVVRAERAFDQDDFQGDSAREPIPIEIADDVRGVAGIDVVEPDIQRSASVLDADGAVVTTTGPQFGVVWDGESLAGVTLKEGRKPSGAGELVLDKATADRENFAARRHRRLRHRHRNLRSHARRHDRHRRHRQPVRRDDRCARPADSPRPLRS